MKLKLNVFSLFLVSLLLFLPVVPAQAAQPTSGACGANLQWSLDKASGVLTITGTGPMTDYSYNAIWYNYYNRDYVKTIVVEDGCTYIGETAFSQLANLTSVTLPASVAGLGRECFVNNRSLREVVMPGVISVGDFCFQNCPALTEAVFPDGLSSVGERCFASCTALTRVVFPGSLDTVGSQIFFACNALQEVVLGDGFTGENCADRAFMGRQSGIARFRIPDSFSRSDALLFDIHFSRFYARTGSVGALTLGRMGLGFTDPDEAHLVRKRYLFDESGNRSGLQLEEILDAEWTDIEIPSGYTVIGCNFGKNVTRVVLPDTVSALTGINGCFSGCTALETVVLPEGLTALPYNTFFQCAALTSIDLPDSLISIGGSAFSRCTALTAITLPERLETVGAYAFAGSGLTAVILPDSVTSVGDYAFQGCKALVSVRLSAALESLGASAFAGCIALSEPLTVPAGVTVLPNHCFESCCALTGVQLPHGLTVIGEWAFTGCRALTALNIPDTVTAIGSYAFQSCSALKDFALPAGVTVLPDYALAGTGITRFAVPETVTSMGGHVFEACAQLTEVSFPSSVTALPDCTFRDCAALKNVALSPALISIGRYAFDGCASLRGIDIPRTVAAIGDGAFRSCKALESFLWPSSVTAISSAMFYDCWELRHLVIPETVTVIRENAFYGCNKLHSLYLPSGVTYMDSMNRYSGITFFFSQDAAYLIGRCDEIGLRYFLTDTAESFMMLPAGLKEIEPGAFEGTSAQEYRIPAGCTSVGSRAFAVLTGGTVIVFMGKDAEIALDAFDGSEVFFVCPYGGTVLNYLRQQGYPVYVTFYN